MIVRAAAPSPSSSPSPQKTVTARIDAHRQAVAKIVDTAGATRKSAEQKAKGDLQALAKYLRAVAREDVAKLGCLVEEPVQAAQE